MLDCRDALEDAAGADSWRVVFPSDSMCVYKVTLGDGHDYAIKAVDLQDETGRLFQVRVGASECWKHAPRA